MVNLKKYCESPKNATTWSGKTKWRKPSPSGQRNPNLTINLDCQPPTRHAFDYQ
jgi:hypothetical protein